MRSIVLYSLAAKEKSGFFQMITGILSGPDVFYLLRGRCTLRPCVAYKQAKISNECAECCCPSSVHVSKGTLFTIFLLADISDDNKHVAFEVTTKVAFI